MKLLFYTLFLIVTTGHAINTRAQQFFSSSDPLFTLPKTYNIQFTEEQITIDGQASETAWEIAKWSDEFMDIEGVEKPDPLYSTRFKMLWGSENLYIYAKLEEPHIWAYYDRHDMIVYHENDFEVFIDPDGDTHNYYEFEVNARNTLFDLYMDKPYRNGGKPHIKWNAEGFESAVYCKGTLNDHMDKDAWWSVEMQIPFRSLSTDGAFEEPVEGCVWKINFSRVQWQTEILHDKYIRKKDPSTGKILPENNWVWSPQGVINMHYPERWGIAVFSKGENGNQIDQTLEEQERLSRYLWVVFYEQRRYHRKHQAYANTLQQLDLPQKGEDGSIRFELTLKASEQTFQAELRTEAGLSLLIDQDGKFLKPTK